MGTLEILFSCWAGNSNEVTTFATLIALEDSALPRHRIRIGLLGFDMLGYFEELSIHHIPLWA